MPGNTNNPGTIGGKGPPGAPGAAGTWTMVMPILPLLINGRFETGDTTGWSTANQGADMATGGILTVIAGIGYTGNFGAQFTSSANYQGIWQSFPFVTGKTYTISGWFRGAVGGENIQLIKRSNSGAIGGGSGNILTTSFRQITWNWVEPAGSGSQPWVGFRALSPVATYYADELELIES